uniref:Peptidase S1 domain-containing protein n=1 Tax=Varanus komodoensis TaxID=61221 RepID=A0A8D2LW32_VARKO
MEGGVAVEAFSPPVSGPRGDVSPAVLRLQMAPRGLRILPPVSFCSEVCGNRPLALGHGTQLRIVGGSDALPGTWPWVVSFQFPTRTGWRHFCAGSLINSRWVLSTAYSESVALGVTQRSRPGPDSQIRKIKRLVDHEKFRPTAHVYDISLIELSEPVECNDYIQPACLPDTHLRRDLLTKCFICGWGITEIKSEGPRANTSDVLQEAEVELVDPYVCNMSWYFTAIRNEHICAMPIEARIDGCRGDGGGPLMCRAENSPRFWVVGINGWGRGCSVQRRPGVFTSTQTFIPWIQKTLNWPPESALVPPYKPTPPPPPPTPSTTRIYPGGKSASPLVRTVSALEFSELKHEIAAFLPKHLMCPQQQPMYQRTGE